MLIHIYVLILFRIFAEKPKAMIVPFILECLRTLAKHETYYQTAKGSGVRAEVVKKVTQSAAMGSAHLQGSAETLLQLLKYFEIRYPSDFRFLIQIWKNQQEV